MKCVDWYMNRFMLLMVVYIIAGFVLFGVDITPIIVIWWVAGALLIATVIWKLELMEEERR